MGSLELRWGNLRRASPLLAPDCPSDLVLTQRFHTCMPQLIPAGFNISPLPNEISCFVIQVLQTLESSLTRSKNQPTKRKTESGGAESRSAPKLASTLTLSSLDCSSLKRARHALVSVPLSSNALEHRRCHSWRASEARGFGNCARCRKLSGYVVQEQFPMKPPSRRRKHPVALHHPGSPKSLQQNRPTAHQSNSSESSSSS